MNKQTELIIVIFGGIFGVHKFIKGDIKMGIIYLFTGGLLGIGWIIDIFKTLTGKGISGKSDSLMGKLAIETINNGELPNIEGTNLNLSDGETCCYMDRAFTFRDKTITTGYTGKRSGVSIKLSKDFTYHTGGSGSKAIRETQRTTYSGILYITTKRIIYTSQKDSFDKTFDKNHRASFTVIREVSYHLRHSLA